METLPPTGRADKARSTPTETDKATGRAAPESPTVSGDLLHQLGAELAAPTSKVVA